MSAAHTDIDLLRTWADDAVALAHALMTLAPVWGTEVHPIADGMLVLSGAGLYVNRVLAAGIDRPLTADEIAVVVERSTAIGVTPSVEVTPSTHPGTRDALTASGFVRRPDADVTALTIAPGATIAAPDDVVVRPLRGTDLQRWMETSSRGWGHTTEAARRASDAFTAAAFVVDQDGMVLARDRADQRLLGAATVTVNGSIATLGGMSTVPEERGRGVQAAMLRHRLAFAVERGCTLAAATAVTGGASERNLVRHGFERRFVIETWSLAETAAPASVASPA